MYDRAQREQPFPRIVLIVPPGGYFAERWKGGRGMPELGILSVAAMLEREGFEVTCLPCQVLELDFKGLQNRLLDLNPGFVGVTATTENRFQSFEVLKLAKLALPHAVTVIGGPHTTTTAQDTLEHLPYVDAVVRGEGELTAVELARAIQEGRQWDDITGLSFRKEGTIRENPARLPLENLDLLPFPARHLIDHDRYGFTVDVPGKGVLPAANLMTSRGCPFNCSFCATPVNWGRKVRVQSVDRVVEEIELVYQRYHARVIWFYDDTFNVNRKRVAAISESILMKNMDISWFCEVRIDLLDRPIMELMKRAGCFHIGFGIESGSERIRKEIVRKDFDIDQARQVIDWCNELDIIANPFFVVSHPTETMEDLEDTHRVMMEFAGRAQESVSILHIYPGTDLERYALDHGQLPPDFSWTVKRDPRIEMLPAAQGDVPLFRDRLSWWQIGKVLFLWSGSRGYSVGNKIPAILRNIRSWKDFTRIAILTACFVRFRLIPKLLATLSSRGATLPDPPASPK